MFKYSLLLFSALCLTLPALAQTVDTPEADLPDGSRQTPPARLEAAKARSHRETDFNLGQTYNEFKKELLRQTGLSYSVDISLLGQRGAPNGSVTPWQTQYYGSANWDMFSSDTWGSGSAQISYAAIRYWGANAATLGDNIGVITDVNDDDTNANYFYQLSYTHQFAGRLKWLAVTLGQFPLFTWDGTAYNSNQQINFINYALSQNASYSYPTASLGGYITITPNDQWQFVAGFQDAHNVTGNRISTQYFDKKKFTSFVSATFTPTIKNLGSGSYGILLYNQPGVPAEPGNSRGWSINALQNIGKKWAVFGRINGTNSNTAEQIKQSYSLGMVYNNPLDRNPLDQIGFAGAVNKLNKEVNGPDTRSVENVLEAYWAWGISEFMTITPDIQFYINPGADKDSNTATVASIRATVMF